MKITVVSFLGLFFLASCECTLAEVSCLRDRVNFRIELEGVDIFSLNSFFDVNSIQIVDSESNQPVENLIINDDYFTINQVSENVHYSIIVNGICHEFELLYSDENLECCNSGGISEIRFDSEIICTGLDMNNSSCAFMSVVTLRIM